MTTVQKLEKYMMVIGLIDTAIGGVVKMRGAHISLTVEHQAANCWPCA